MCEAGPADSVGGSGKTGATAAYGTSEELKSTPEVSSSVRGEIGSGSRRPLSRGSFRLNDHNQVKMAITDSLMRRFILRRKKSDVTNPTQYSNGKTPDSPHSPSRVRTALRHALSAGHLGSQPERQSSLRRALPPGTERPPKKQLSFREPEKKADHNKSTSRRCKCRDGKERFVRQISGSQTDTESSNSSEDLNFDLEKMNSVKETTIDSWSSDEDEKIPLRKSVSSEVLFVPTRPKGQSQAAEVVRTIGQAFEVCHKINQQRGNSATTEDSGVKLLEHKELLEEEKKSSCGGTAQEQTQAIINGQAKQPQTPSVSEAPPPFGASEGDANPASLSTLHQLQLLRAQMEYQSQAAQQALSQVKLLREQLSAENAARIDAMSQNQLLTHQNRELIHHIQILVKQIQELEVSARCPQQPLQETSLSPIRASNTPSVFDFPSGGTVSSGPSTTTHWLQVGSTAGPPSGGSSPRPQGSPNVGQSLLPDLGKLRLDDRLCGAQGGLTQPVTSWSTGTSPLPSLPPLLNGYGTLPSLSVANPSPFMRQYSLPVPGSKSNFPHHLPKSDMARLTINESAATGIEAASVPSALLGTQIRGRHPSTSDQVSPGSLFLP